jgi:hypothetical protein
MSAHPPYFQNSAKKQLFLYLTARPRVVSTAEKTFFTGDFQRDLRFALRLFLICAMMVMEHGNFLRCHEQFREDIRMKRTLAFCWTALFLCFGMQSLCFAGEEGEKTANIPAPEDYIGCWSTGGAAAVIRPSGSRFEVILETYDCGPDGFIYGYLCDYREEEGVLEARGTGIKRFSGWDEAREQEIAQTEYEDGSAVFQINEEGLLIWKDRTGNAGEGLLFSGMGDYEGTWVCGGISIDFIPLGESMTA